MKAFEAKQLKEEEKNNSCCPMMVGDWKIGIGVGIEIFG